MGFSISEVSDLFPQVVVGARQRSKIWIWRHAGYARIHRLVEDPFKILKSPGFHRTKKTSANKMWVACAKITVLTLVTCWFLWKNRYILEVKLQTVELLPPKKQSRSCDFCSPFCHLRNPSYPSWKLTYPTFGDDVPFPKVGYVSFLEDKLSSVPCNSWRLTTTCAAI